MPSGDHPPRPGLGDKPKTAAKVLRRAGTVLEWAVVTNLRTDNPARAVARAAATLEARALAQGIASTVLTPEGGDFNDETAALGAAGAGRVTQPRHDVKYAHETAICGSLPREPA